MTLHWVKKILLGVFLLAGVSLFKACGSSSDDASKTSLPTSVSMDAA